MIPKDKVSQCKRAIKIDQRQRVIYLTILHNHDKTTSTIIQIFVEFTSDHTAAVIPDEMKN